MDEYILKILEIIRKIGMELEIISGWYNLGIVLNSDPIEFISDECLIIWTNWDDYFKEVNKRKINNSEIKDQFIWEQIWKPKIFTFCSYIREFVNLLSKYTQNNNEVKNNKYLEYWNHLIFKTGFYQNKIFDEEKDIKFELNILKSFLSEPLHAYSVSYEISLLSEDENIEILFNDLRNNSNKYFNFTRYSNNENLNIKKCIYYSAAEIKINDLFKIIKKYSINKNSFQYEILEPTKGEKEEYIKFSNSQCTYDKEFYDLENFLCWTLEESNHNKKYIDAFDYMLSKRKNKIDF